MPVPGQAPAWRRTLRRYRRPLAAALAAVAVLLALSSLRPATPATTPVLVTRGDVRAGQVLTPDDVEVAAWPADLVPPAALAAVADLPDRPVVAPLAAGEVLVPGRFLAPSLLAAYGAGLVATPVRLADAGAAALLRVGDVVDVLAATAASTPEEVGGAARTVARAVRVLVAGTPADGGDAGALSGAVVPADGALVVLATTPATAADIAGAAVTSRLSVVLRSG